MPGGVHLTHFYVCVPENGTLDLRLCQCSAWTEYQCPSFKHFFTSLHLVSCPGMIPTFHSLLHMLPVGFFFLMICVHVLGSFVYLFFMYLFVSYKVSLCSPGWSGTYYVPQAVLELMANLLPQSVSVPYFVTFI